MVGAMEEMMSQNIAGVGVGDGTLDGVTREDFSEMISEHTPSMARPTWRRILKELSRGSESKDLHIRKNVGCVSRRLETL